MTTLWNSTQSVSPMTLKMFTLFRGLIGQLLDLRTRLSALSLKTRESFRNGPLNKFRRDEQHDKLHTFILQVIITYTKSTHYSDTIMGAMASQITSLTIVYTTVHFGADRRKHQSSASLAFVREIHRWPVNSPHKWPVTRKIFPFDEVIMWTCRPAALIRTTIVGLCLSRGLVTTNRLKIRQP